VNTQTLKHPSRTPSRVSAFRCGFGLLGLFLVGCFDITPDPVPITYGSITDGRDSQIYRTLSVKGVTWMQQDLNFQDPGSSCVDTASACARRLYPWSTAMGVDSQFDTTLLGDSSGVRQGGCPEGWHLPTAVEWQELINIFDLPGITGDWTSSSGFDLKGWDRSIDVSLGWYWIAEESGPEKARFVGFRISYPMYGPTGYIWVEQVTSKSKKSKLGIRCLLDRAK
jgi:Fibrobacter succinogenes major domain (Fib_succ_major)